MMTITKDLEGIVFNIFNYKENDLIVDILSYQYGFMQLYVRGGQKTTSKSFFVFRLFNVITFDVSKLNIEELSIYKSGSVDKIFDYTQLNYEQMNIVMVCSELLMKIKHQQDIMIKAYYEDLKKVIEALSKGTSSFYLLNYFLYKTLIILGCAPILDCCCICDKTNDIVVYDIINSGFVCQNCFNNSSKYFKDRELLNYLYKLGSSENISNENKLYDKVIFELLIDVLNENAGVYLVSAKYIF